MKISEEEVKAALAAWNGPFKNNEGLMRSVLEAAYTVRKARKAAKRAKANQKQTVYHVSLGEIDFNALRRQWSLNPAQAVPEPSKPEQPEHRLKVGDRVVHAIHGQGSVVSVDEGYLPYRVDFGDGKRGWFNAARLSPESDKPEWNGKFEVGKAYRTRDGKKAIIQHGQGIFPVVGTVEGFLRGWQENGEVSLAGKHHLDLVGPWED